MARNFKTPEQVIRSIMEGQANAAVLEYGTDLARDTYAKDTPGQQAGDTRKVEDPTRAKPIYDLALDGVPKQGGEMEKPNAERLAGLGEKEMLKPNQYLRLATQDVIKEDAYDQFLEMNDEDFDNMIDVLIEDELNDLEEGIFKALGTGIKGVAKGVGAVAKGTYKAGKWAAPKVASGVKKTAARLSTAGRADAAEKRLAAIKKKKLDRERINKASTGIEKEGGTTMRSAYAKVRKAVQDSYELGSREYWTVTDEQDLTEGAMSKAQIKTAASAIWKMRQKAAQKKADTAASSVLKSKSSPAAKAARQDSASDYGKPKKDSADVDTSYKPEKKRGRGEKDLPHIVSQLRRVADMGDKASGVKYKDGTTKNVKQKHAQSWLKKHDASKPAQKLDMYKSHDSHKTFKSYAEDINQHAWLKRPKTGWTGDKVVHGKKGYDQYMAQSKAKKAALDPKKATKKQIRAADARGEIGEENVDEAQRRWDKSSKGRAYRRLSDVEKQRLAKKNELVRQMRAYRGDDEDYESKGKMRKPTVGGAKAVYRGQTRKEQTEALIAHLGREKPLSEQEIRSIQIRSVIDEWADPHGGTIDDAPITRKNDPGKKGDPAPYAGKYKLKKQSDGSKKYVRAEGKDIQELSPGTLHNYMTKRLSQTPPWDMDSKQQRDMKRAGKQLYKKEYSKTGKPVKDKQGKTVGLVHSEATADQVIKQRYQDNNDNPHSVAYLGRSKSKPKLQTYKPIPGKDSESKKGKMAAIKKQVARRPADYGVDGKHDAMYPANKHEIQKTPARQKSKKTAGQYEATADQVLKHRYGSEHPSDNPQNTKYLGKTKTGTGKMKTYKPIPGTKIGSKKGKMAALKKQIARRPKQYGVTGKKDPMYPANKPTSESYAKRIAQGMEEGAFKRLATAAAEKKRLADRDQKSYESDMNKMADKTDKNWWKHQDKAMTQNKRNKEKINKINNMGTRHGTY